jgi:NADH-quinone oxidoreductase subunit I
MAYQASKDPTEDVRERLFLPELLKGLAVTTRHFFRNLFNPRDTNPQVIDRVGSASLVSTVQYPEEKIPYPDGYRGLHRLVPRDDGKPRCVACYMCATICPAQCIYIEAGEYEREDANSESKVIEKFPVAFVIDELRCIVCGLCVEACPKDAIRMDTHTHTPSEYTRQGFVWDIPRLLNGPPVSHPSDPWNKRESSAPPPHVHKEAHVRIGEGTHGHAQGTSHGAHPAPLPASTGPRVITTTDQPVPVTKFLK